MKRMRTRVLVRVLILLAGLTVAHPGVTLLLLADLDADPFHVPVRSVWRTLADTAGWAAPWAPGH